MKKATLTIITSIIVCFSYAQLQVDTASNYQQLVDNFILSGVTASNVVYTGETSAVGTFTNGATTNIGMTDGIFLTTGVVDSFFLVGTPPMSMLSTANATDGDADLELLLAGNLTYDAAVLEFDLVPVGNVLEFKYVFASEEYPEYVNSAFNDIFAFFISGQNPLGGNYDKENIALVPGTTSFVSINNVNDQTNAAYYIANDTLSAPTIPFDGFTTVLTAQISVVAGQSYHLKMAIADVADRVLDSGIFLKAQSMKSYNPNTIEELLSQTVKIANPVKRGSEFAVELAKRGILDIQVIDCSGRVISSTSLAITRSGTQYIDVNDVFGDSPNGLYFLSTTFDNNRETVKLLLE